MRSLKSELIRNGFYPAKRREVKERTSTKGKQSEQLTDKEWAEIMGVYRDTYRRGKGGAFKQR